jgi:hypothetical protein
MITITNIFITTITSLFVGGCSLYNILQYLKKINKHSICQLAILQNKISEYSRKQIILENKYVKIKEEVNGLISTIIKLEKLYFESTIIKNNIDETKKCSDNCSYLEKDNIQPQEKNTLIDFDCAEIINYEEDTSLKLEYVNNNYNTENCLRSRSSSITELNFNGMARLLFG